MPILAFSCVTWTQRGLYKVVIFIYYLSTRFTNEEIFKIILGVFLAQALLLATHDGEFWPFSIYPMFSKAGNDWSRVVVRDVRGMDSSEVWKNFGIDNLPGKPVALRQHGVETIDASDFIHKTISWTESRKAAFVRLLGAESLEAQWLVFTVRGSLDDGEVDIEATPLFLITGGQITRVGSP